MISPDTALALARLAQDFCAILLWGGAGFLAFLAPAQLSRQLSQSLLPPVRLLAFVALVAATVILPFQSARLGEGWPDVLNPNVMYDVLFQSNVGFSWAAQLAASVLVILTAIIFPLRLRLFAALAGLLLASRTLSGHAVMLDGPSGLLLHLSYLVHVLAAGAWVGALLPVILIMRNLSRQVTEPETKALRNFSIIGHFAVAFTVLTGAINAALIRDRFLPLIATAYDETLALKIVIVVAMISIAIVNRYVIVPRLSPNPRAAKILVILTTIEFLLVGFVLIVVNILGATNPH